MSKKPVLGAFAVLFDSANGAVEAFVSRFYRIHPSIGVPRVGNPTGTARRNPFSTTSSASSRSSTPARIHSSAAVSGEGEAMTTVPFDWEIKCI